MILLSCSQVFDDVSPSQVESVTTKSSSLSELDGGYLSGLEYGFEFS